MTRRNLFLGPWLVLVGCTLAEMVGNGPMLYFTSGVFMRPITAEFGWGRGTISLAVGLATTLLGITTPLVGKLVDRYGVRCVVLPAVILFSLSFAAVSQTPPSPLAFVLLYGLCGLVGAGQSAVSYVKTISGWFDARRGLALGIAMAGIGVGTSVMPRAAQALIVGFGWRGAYLGQALMQFMIAFPAVALLVREAPSAVAARTVPQSGSGVSPPGLTITEALKGSPRMWIIAISVVLVAVAVNGTIGHVVPMLIDRGISPAVAASMLGAVGLSTIAGRLVVGYLLDRIFAPYVAAGFFLVPLAGIAFIGSGLAGLAPLLGIICIGIGIGAEFDLIGFLVGRYFGLRSFGEIYGYLYGIFTFASGAGTYLMGLCFDRTRSYNLALLGFGVALLVACVVISRLGPYPFPATRAAATVNGETASAA